MRLLPQAAGPTGTNCQHDGFARAQTTVLSETRHGAGLTLLRVLRRGLELGEDRKSTRLNSSHLVISYAVFCLKKKKLKKTYRRTLCANHVWHLISMTEI